MKQVVLSIFLLFCLPIFGQVRFEVGGQAGLALEDGRRDYIGWGPTLGLEVLIDDNNGFTFETGYSKYISTSGHIGVDVIPLKIGYKRFLSGDAPEGIFFHLQSGIMFLNARQNSGKGGVVGINLGWNKGTRVSPTFGYYWNKFQMDYNGPIYIPNSFNYWQQYLMFKLSATF